MPDHEKQSFEEFFDKQVENRSETTRARYNSEGIVQKRLKVIRRLIDIHPPSLDDYDSAITQARALTIELGKAKAFRRLELEEENQSEKSP